MDNSNEKNLNITINNKAADNDEVVISLVTIFKKLKKYFVLWLIIAVVVFVMTFGYATLTTQINKPKLNALISFSYSGIEKGNDPNGRKFDVNTIKNPSVIESALTELGISLENLETIREGISVFGIIPSDAIDRITVYQNVYESAGNLNAAKEMLDVTYYPTQFKVYFDYNETDLTSAQATDVLNTILKKYQDYFYEEYGYNESLGTAVSAINYEDYDYSEAVDVFDTNLTTLRRYVRQLSNEDATRFRSSVTGYTFDDLYQAITTIQDIDLDKISSYITVNNLTKNKDAAISYYDYRINSLNRSKTSLEEQLKSVQESIEAYEKDQIFIFSGTDETNTNMSSTVASEQYDNMIKSKLRITEDLADTKQNINYYKERKEALQNNPAGSEAKAKDLDVQLKDLSDKISELIDVTSQTSDDYYRNVTLRNAYNVLVPASSTVTNRLLHIINNAKIPVVILEALAILVFLMIAVVEAIISDGRKRKGLPEAVETEEKKKEEPKAENKSSKK
ncbi:MAG: lipopolysaccharide biosynthesis protein [Ruminococcus sp.]|nr:lipopolysaccharide biosynthesis protein [Ruminococcus sp.]